jgi:hypothetical protein
LIALSSDRPASEEAAEGTVSRDRVMSVSHTDKRRPRSAGRSGGRAGGLSPTGSSDRQLRRRYGDPRIGLAGRSCDRRRLSKLQERANRAWEALASWGIGARQHFHRVPVGYGYRASIRDGLPRHGRYGADLLRPNSFDAIRDAAWLLRGDGTPIRGSFHIRCCLRRRLQRALDRRYSADPGHMGDRESFHVGSQGPQRGALVLRDAWLRSDVLLWQPR